MRTVTVVFDLGATSVVTVDVPDDADPETIIEAADLKSDAHLCHQCAYGITLGDPEPIVIDEDGEEVWTAEAVAPRLLPGLFVALDGGDCPTIWARGDDLAHPASQMVRTADNARLFDAIAALLPREE